MTTPPGFERGMVFDGGKNVPSKQTFGIDDILNLADMIKEPTMAEESKEESPEKTESVKEDAIDDIVSDVVLPITQLPLLAEQHREWAHVIDVNTPFDQFHDMVPELAHEVLIYS
jgi:antiviral helicase SKI2